MAADVSAITYFAPLMAFFVVFLLVFAVLYKSKIIGDSKWVALFVSFLVSSIFVSAAGVSRYVLTITPWFAALLISLFFLLVIIGMVGGKSDSLHNGLKTFFVIAAIVVFLVSGIVVFSDSLAPYLPGTIESYGNPVSNWLYSPQVVGAVVLLAITALISWILIKAK